MTEPPSLDEATLQALSQARQPARKPAAKLPLLGHLVVLSSLFILAWLLAANYFGLARADLSLARKVVRAALTLSVIFTSERAIRALLVSRVRDGPTQYNLNRIVQLIALCLAALALASMLVANLYAGLVSFGVVSLVVGLAVQTPMTSFIGWIYLLVRAPYRVGDRIKIGDLQGDVIDVSYLDTTLWEFGGDYLSGDHPSGRIIRFPNSQVLESPVVNYTWPLFPYIWNEVKFQIAYNSDLDFVAETMERIAAEELGEEMMARVAQYRDLLARTPVNELQVRERPTVSFGVSENTWIDARIRFLALPREAGQVKGRLLRKMLAALNREPERVLFPKGENR